MKLINNMLKGYLEKHGYIVFKPLCEIQKIVEHTSDVEEVKVDPLFEEAFSIDEDIAIQLYDANALNADLQKEINELKKTMHVDTEQAIVKSAL